MLDNIFLPIFATLNPQAHLDLSELLSLISAFDPVDDESASSIKKDRTFSSRERAPPQWDITDNPSYKYYNFYLQTNLEILNELRSSLGLSQFSYRPHAGEAGEMHHLDTAFLLADSIAHGINLRKSAPLQYLYYLCGIGLAMSPCSNNHLFLSYEKSPFKEFFAKGLNVSLSTDDPLMFHQTKEPSCTEEYSLAKQLFRLSSADLCELARNSVLQSGFPKDVIERWLGSSDRHTNVMEKSNVPMVRLRYRSQCHTEEMGLLLNAVDDAMKAFRAAIPQTVRPLGPLLLAGQPPLKGKQKENGEAKGTGDSPALLQLPMNRFREKANGDTDEKVVPTPWLMLPPVKSVKSSTNGCGTPSIEVGLPP